MIGGSLRIRFIVTAAAAIGLALVLAWGGLSVLFERHLERQAQADLERFGAVLAAALSVDAQGRPVLSAAPNDPRFHTPGGGLYWRVSTPAGALASRSLWDGALPATGPVETDAWNAQIAPGPFENEVMQVVRRIRPTADGAGAVVQVASDHAVVDAAQAAFAGDLAVSLAVLWIVLLLAAWVQILWGLQPLSGVRRELVRLKEDPQARVNRSAFPDEVAPLADEINALADARADDMARARARAQNLAHALKTPLTALKLQVADLRPQDRLGVERSLSLLQQAIGAELAAAAPAPATTRVQAPLRPMIERLIGVVARAHADRGIIFINECLGSHMLAVTDEGALEMFGALIDNAAKHAHSQVVVGSSLGPDGLTVSVDDDGPGIPEDQMAHAMRRGVRLDERGGGQGLGLAVASEVALLSGGTLRLATSRLGGLCVTVHWPIRPQATGAPVRRV